VFRDGTEVAKSDIHCPFVADQWQHVVIQFAPPRILLVVNGKQVVEYADNAWLPGLDTFAFRFFLPMQVDNVRVYRSAGTKEIGL
jgi:hypothetical protein